MASIDGFNPMSSVIHVHRISPDEGHSFFGYYDKSPWNKDHSRITFLNVSFCDRSPDTNDEARIIVKNLESGVRGTTVANTRAWNWQQGCMLRWLDSGDLLFNDRDGPCFIARVIDCNGREVTRTPFPIYDLSGDGDSTVSLSFSRLAILRPGYGYAGSKDPYSHLAQPGEDGLFIGSVRDGRQELAVSIDQIARHEPRRFFKDRVHWFNHATFNPSGKKLVFLHRCRMQSAARSSVTQFGSGIGAGNWKKAIRRGLGSVYRRLTGRSFAGIFSRLFVLNADGSGLQCLIDSGVCSHFGWRDDNTLIVWAALQGSGPAYWLLDVSTGQVVAAGEGLPKEDGHCSFSRDGRWLLTDTYQSVEKKGCILLRDMVLGATHSLAKYVSSPGFVGELRCDFHPRLRDDNKEVCFDSSHSGTRGVYLLDVSKITGAEST